MLLRTNFLAEAAPAKDPWDGFSLFAQAQCIVF